MSEQYEQLKAQFIKEIIGDGDEDRAAVERKITRLRDAFFEKQDRLLQSVKDIKAIQDGGLTGRAVNRLQEEKTALDDAIIDVLENRKNVTLPKLDEVAHVTRKALNIPQRQATILPALVRATFSVLVSTLFLAICASVPLYLASRGKLTTSIYESPREEHASFRGYISYVKGAPILNFDDPMNYVYWSMVLLPVVSSWMFLFRTYRNVR